MIVRPDMRRYELMDFLIEFKYIGLPDIGMTHEALTKSSHEDLTALPPVQRKLADSRVKLKRYGDALSG